MKSTIGSEGFPPLFGHPHFLSKAQLPIPFTLNSELKVYIYSGLQFGEALRSQSELPDLLRHTSPQGVTSKAIPGQPRGLEPSGSGQLLGRRPLQRSPSVGEVAREGRPGLLHAPSGRTAAAARSPRRRAGSLSPSPPRGRLGGGMEGEALAPKPV